MPIYARLLGARDRYAADTDYATLPQRWDDEAGQIVDDGLARISHSGLRDRARAELAVPLTQERGAIAAQAFRGAAANHAVNRDAMLRNLVQRATLDPNDTLLGGGVEAYHAMIDDAAARGYLTADDALAEKRRGALALCEGTYAAMARRDPPRAISELHGETDGHPLLAHLPQERKDALIRKAQQRQNANGIDASLSHARQQENARRASDQAEAAIVADLAGNAPSVTANAILDNTALSAEARQRLLDATARQNEPEPAMPVSQAATLHLLDRIRRPQGDAARIDAIGPVVDAYNSAALNRDDLGYVGRQIDEANSPDGKSLARRRRDFFSDPNGELSDTGDIAAAKPDVAVSDGGPTSSPDANAPDKLAAINAVEGGNGSADSPLAAIQGTIQARESLGISNVSQLYFLERDIDQKIQRYRRDGKDPHNLFDPSKPDYVGTPQSLKPYQEKLAQWLPPPLFFFARPPLITPRPLTPLEELPSGSAGGPGAGQRFPRSFNDRQPENTPCTYCGSPTTGEQGADKLNGDHVIPRSKGENNSPENYTPSCRTCNLKKGPRTPQEWYSSPKA